MKAAVLRARAPGGLASKGGVPLIPRPGRRRACAGRTGSLAPPRAVVGAVARGKEIA